MGKNVLIGIFLLSLFSCDRVEVEKPAIETIHDSTVSFFDSSLAQKLGADQYGMKKYVVAFLKKGPNRNRDSAEAAALQRAHLDNMKIMAEQGKMVLAGPFLDDGDLRGFYIFYVKDMEEAQALTSSDPAVKAGSLIMELHPWYGSAALSEIYEIHKRIAKTPI